MRSRSEMIGEKDGNEKSNVATLYFEAPEMRKLSISKRRPLLKSQISDPELLSGSSFPHRHLSEVPSTIRSDCTNQQQTGIAPSIIVEALQSSPPKLPTKPGSRFTYHLAKPRLSPMEYARLYLIEKALSERQGRPCELPKPEETWYWTPQWEKFLIVPRIPDCIRRDFPLKSDKVDPPPDVTCSKQDESDNESVATIKQEVPKSGLARLSLNLGRMSMLYPSILGVMQSKLNQTQLLDESPPQLNSSIRDRNMEIGISGQELPLHGAIERGNDSASTAKETVIKPDEDEPTYAQSILVDPHGGHAQQ